MSIFKTYDEKDTMGIFSHLYYPLQKKKPNSLKKKRIIVIAGPTGVGKTKLSIEIAKVIGGEIISIDSMQVYRHMDIGTAKATKEEQKEVPHHMIDIKDVKDEYNVVAFYHESHRILKDIIKRKKVPIAVGGSGFYMHTFLYGPPLGPASRPEVRENLEKQMERLGPEILYEQLQMLDPEYAKTISENDKYKIIRALEIITILRKPVSSLEKPSKLPSDDYDFRCWFLNMPKEKLYISIDLRCEEMIKKGLIEEVKELKKIGLKQNISASQAIGYRQCLKYLENEADEKAKEEFIWAFKKASKNYVKRQLTWFKKEKIFRWLDIDKLGLDRTMEYILQDYEQGD